MSTISLDRTTYHTQRTSLLSQLIQSVGAWWRRGDLHAELMNLGDRCLHDIGLSRASDNFNFRQQIAICCNATTAFNRNHADRSPIQFRPYR